MLHSLDTTRNGIDILWTSPSSVRHYSCLPTQTSFTSPPPPPDALPSLLLPLPFPPFPSFSSPLLFSPLLSLLSPPSPLLSPPPPLLSLSGWWGGRQWSYLRLSSISLSAVGSIWSYTEAKQHQLDMKPSQECKLTFHHTSFTCAHRSASVLFNW